MTPIEEFSNHPRNTDEQLLLCKLFDPRFYLSRHPDVRDSGIDPLLHFIEHGARESRSPHPLFDVPFYLAHQPEVANAGMNPVLHFLRTGARAGANPHPLFDTIYYLNQYSDVADAGINPLIHFIENGAAEGRNPHPFFNTTAYLAANPQVAISHENPLIHYVSSWETTHRHILPTYSSAALHTESLHRELTITRMQAAQLTRELKALHANQRNLSTHLPGQLLHCVNPIYLDRVFYCHNGKRHWVRSTDDHLRCYGLSPRNIVTVGEDEIRQYELAGALPMPWPDDIWDHPVRYAPHDLREISTLRLRGSGIEFGAGSGPMSVPLHCEVQFSDLFAEDDLTARAYAAQGKDFVRLTYQMGMENMDPVPDESLDFVIACHVIEHLRNPLRAMDQVYRKLKPGGQYVLVVPEKRMMFDRDRALTSLEHLISDFEKPDADRDIPHYFEFFSKVYSVPDEQLPQRVQDAIFGNHDLHFHTWTYESFAQMVEYTRRTFTPWRSVWSQPPLWGHPDAHEFNFVLTK